jgi:hypothetical protein
MSLFGLSLDGADAERALLAHLRDWMPTYIPEIRRQKDPSERRWPNGVSAVRSYRVTHFVAEKWPEDQIPCLIAHSPGMADDPIQEGEGVISARYLVILLAIAEARDEENTKELARLYSSAARMAIMQHPDLNGFAEGVAMGREEPFPVRKGVDAERTLMAVQVPYIIDVANILDVSRGPASPLEDPEDPPAENPHVREGGGSVEVSPVQALRDGGFWDS